MRNNLISFILCIYIMDKKVAILVLVKSLSKSEKRYFKLHCNLQSGDKIYSSLFDILESSDSMDQAYNQFCVSHKESNFDVAVKYLYSVVIECLISHRDEQDVQAKIFNLISGGAIMFERGLIDEALSELAKARKMAEHYEHDILLLLIRRTELQYLRAMDFTGVSEKRLVGKHISINDALKSARSAIQHMQLYDVLKYRITNKGYARTDRQKQDLNDLVISELNMVANISHKSFETQKLSMLFQATYFLNAGEYITAIRFYEHLITLFEQNRNKMMNPPMHYLNTVVGILETLQSAGLYDDMPFFISKLKLIGQGAYSINFNLDVLTYTYLYEQSCFINIGEGEAAEALRVQYDDILFRKMTLTGLNMQLKLNLSDVKLHIYMGNIGEARKSMRKILRVGRSLQKFPDFRIARLLNLIINIEIGDYDFVERETKSIRSDIYAEKGTYQYRTEYLLFKLLRQHPITDDKKERARLWRRYEKEIVAIRLNKYERPLLKDFDFLLWIESALTGRPIIKILQSSQSMNPQIENHF